MRDHCPLAHPIIRHWTRITIEIGSQDVCFLDRETAVDVVDHENWVNHSHAHTRTYSQTRAFYNDYSNLYHRFTKLSRIWSDLYTIRLGRPGFSLLWLSPSIDLSLPNHNLLLTTLLFSTIRKDLLLHALLPILTIITTPDMFPHRQNQRAKLFLKIVGFFDHRGDLYQIFYFNCLHHNNDHLPIRVLYHTYPTNQPTTLLYKTALLPFWDSEILREVKEKRNWVLASQFAVGKNESFCFQENFQFFRKSNKKFRSELIR